MMSVTICTGVFYSFMADINNSDLFFKLQKKSGGFLFSWKIEGIYQSILLNETEADSFFVMIKSAMTRFRSSSPVKIASCMTRDSVMVSSEIKCTGEIRVIPEGKISLKIKSAVIICTGQEFAELFNQISTDSAKPDVSKPVESRGIFRNSAEKFLCLTATCSLSLSVYFLVLTLCCLIFAPEALKMMIFLTVSASSVFLALFWFQYRNFSSLKDTFSEALSSAMLPLFYFFSSSSRKFIEFIIIIIFAGLFSSLLLVKFYPYISKYWQDYVDSIIAFINMGL